MSSASGAFKYTWPRSERGRWQQMRVQSLVRVTSLRRAGRCASKPRKPGSKINEGSVSNRL
jgi:hypothetical protein